MKADGVNESLTEFFNAKERIGSEEKDRMDWAIAFSQRPLEGVTERDIDALRYDLFAFYLTLSEVQTGQRATQWTLDLDGNITPFPKRHQVASIQRQLLDIVQAVAKEQSYRLNPIKVSFAVERSSQGFVNLIERVEHIEDGVSLAFLKLIDHCGRLETCSDCHHYFLQRRNTHKFCSIQYQSRDATRRYRQAQREGSTEGGQLTESKKRNGRSRSTGRVQRRRIQSKTKCDRKTSRRAKTKPRQKV